MTLDQGPTGEDPAHQLDGSLVLCGVDHAKLKGDSCITQLAGLKSKCPTDLLITVTYRYSYRKTPDQGAPYIRVPAFTGLKIPFSSSSDNEASSWRSVPGGLNTDRETGRNISASVTRDRHGISPTGTVQSGHPDR